MSQFADDTSLMAFSHRTSTIVGRLQRAADSIVRYLKRWRVRVNPQKSEACMFTRKRAQRHRPVTQINVGGEVVPWKGSIKYLGLTLDKTLTFRDHLGSRVQKGGKLVRALYPLVSRNSKLAIRHKVLLYKVVLRPSVCYACPVWSSCAATHLLAVQRFQNKTLKMMLGLPPRTPTRLVHEMTGLETVSEYVARLTDSFVSGCRTNVNGDIAALVSSY